MGCGIYKITNILTNQVYVGSSIDVKSREYKHFWMLKKNIHNNDYLQNSYNKYGEENFIFEVLELCDYTDLVDRENHFIDKLKSNEHPSGFNLAKVNEFRRNTYNKEVKIKLSKYNLNVNGNITPFVMTSLVDGTSVEFDNLVDAAEYLISNGYSKGKPKYVRMKISFTLRGKMVNNGSNGSIRKTCYKHKVDFKK